MDLPELTIAKTSRFKPWSFEYTDIAPNILLLCKLLLALMLVHHFYYKLNDPFIPFISALDYFNTIPGLFKNTLRVTFILAASALFFNIKVRLSCVVLGVVILLQQLASKPAFENHTFVCSCVFLLVGFSNKKQQATLLIWQISIIYLGAFLNKFLDPDWQNGLFMDNWLANARQNPPYLFISDLLPEKWFATILSWGAMIAELLVGILILSKKHRWLVLWMMLFFHTILFSFTAFRYGHFYENVLIFLLLFLIWPKGKINITTSKPILSKLYSLLNWDNKFVWTNQNNSEYWLTLSIPSGKKYNNFNGIRKLLIHTPAFFILLFCLDVFLILLFYNNRQPMFVIDLIIIWSLIFFYIPILCQKLFTSKS